MKFEVTILGSGAALPTLTRNSTSQYVTCQNRHILIDCGEGTQLQMRKFGVKFQRLQVILISHLHGDHFFGLVGLISTMRLLGRDKNLTIVCPKGLKKIIVDQLEIGHTTLDFEIDFIELESKFEGLVFEDNALEIIAFTLKHKIPAHGFLIREKEKERNLRADAMKNPLMKLEYVHLLKKGHDVQTDSGEILKSKDFTKKPKRVLSYAFCSDTAYSERIIAHITGADALYHEATFTEAQAENAKKTMHSTAIQAAQIAKLAEVKSLYMGHLSARYSDGSQHEKEARMVFENAHYVQDGSVFLVK